MSLENRSTTASKQSQGTITNRQQLPNALCRVSWFLLPPRRLAGPSHSTFLVEGFFSRTSAEFLIFSVPILSSVMALGHQLQFSDSCRLQAARPQKPPGFTALCCSLHQALPVLSDKAMLKDSGSQAIDGTLRT